MTQLVKASTVRKAAHPIDSMILDRWSPRAMSGEAITNAQLMTLLEAARWAPSAYNEQPWRYIYGMKGTPAWQALFDLLVEFNQQWCKNAGALLIVLSRKLSTHNDQPVETHSYDTGASWMNFAIQGTAMGLVVHGMSGFDYDKARTAFSLPEHIQVEAMIAVGAPADKSQLPAEMAKKEIPSDRKPISAFAFEGKFEDKK